MFVRGGASAGVVVRVYVCIIVCLCVEVRQLVLVRYFTEETTETISRQLFADSQKLILIVDGQ